MSVELTTVDQVSNKVFQLNQKILLDAKNLTRSCSSIVVSTSKRWIKLGRLPSSLGLDSTQKHLMEHIQYIATRLKVQVDINL